jgi:hypothetical protein
MTAHVEMYSDFACAPGTALQLEVRSPVGPLCVQTSGCPGSPLRAQIEAFVREVYRDRFGAQVCSFLPDLLGARDRSGALHAALGYRIADRETLFLEQYLDAPIERALGEAIGAPLRRGQILEVGNLATHPAAVAPAFLQAFLLWVRATTRCDWLVFTGTRSLLALLRRLGASEPLRLAAARPERLGPGGDDWGAYYEQQPHVVAASIAELSALLDPRLFDENELRTWLRRGLELRR